MNPHSHASGHGFGVVALIGVVIVAAVVYLALALRQRRDPRGWSVARTAAFLIGCDLVAIALVPRLVPYPDGGFREHMVMHLLIGMVAPILLVVAAPVTLLLRSVPVQRARQLTRVLRSRPAAVLGHPMVALVLNIGGMGVLYFTPLYTASTEDGALHLAIHVHFLAAGSLFAWVIAGPDPAPRRPSVPARLVVLGIAIAAHATLSQFLYAGLFVDVPVSAEERQGGAALMYYGGDIAELVLAFALVSSWHPRRQRVALMSGSPALASARGAEAGSARPAG